VANPCFAPVVESGQLPEQALRPASQRLTGRGKVLPGVLALFAAVLVLYFLLVGGLSATPLPLGPRPVEPTAALVRYPASPDAAPGAALRGTNPSLVADRADVRWVSVSAGRPATSLFIARAAVGQIGTGLVKHVLVLAQGQDPNGVLNQVLNNIRNWLMGLLVGLATLFLTIGGVRYLLAGGDPGEVEAAKRSFKSAAIGYALAALAPSLVQILRSLVGA